LAKFSDLICQLKFFLFEWYVLSKWVRLFLWNLKQRLNLYRLSAVLSTVVRHFAANISSMTSNPAPRVPGSGTIVSTVGKN